MDKEEIIALLDVIYLQESSSILGGMIKDYEELERLGYIKITWNDVQPHASMTKKGFEFLDHIKET